MINGTESHRKNLMSEKYASNYFIAQISVMLMLINMVLNVEPH